MGIRMDKNGNICHARSGSIIKRRIERNNFTGESNFEFTDFGRGKTASQKEIKETGNSAESKPVEPGAAAVAGIQQLKAEIADKKVESNQVCDYCKRSVGFKVACSFSVQDFSCFRGRQLSAV